MQACASMGGIGDTVPCSLVCASREQLNSIKRCGSILTTYARKERFGA